jgi:predicted MFS family arabinose efflux permease
MWISGIAGGLLSALGSLVGGFVCDRMSRMHAYALSGGLGAVFAAYLAFAPHTPWTYALGYSGYSIAAGFAYAVFTALVLEVMGRRHHAAGTAYALFVATGNVPILYMTWLDGVGSRRRRPRLDDRRRPRQRNRSLSAPPGGPLRRALFPRNRSR